MTRTALPQPRVCFVEGARAGAPFVLVVAPFGLLFGTVGTDAGLSTFEVMAFSVLVIAGASQFAALQLLIDQAPVAVALLTGLAVNLRTAMYSASLMPYLAGAALARTCGLSDGGSGVCPLRAAIHGLERLTR